MGFFVWLVFLPVHLRPASRMCLSGSASSACPVLRPPQEDYMHSVWLFQYQQSGLELGQSLTSTGLTKVEV